jgi:hypothetical protein
MDKQICTGMNPTTWQARQAKTKSVLIVLKFQASMINKYERSTTYQSKVIPKVNIFEKVKC